MADGLDLSICIATVNRAGYLAESLASILSQMTDAVEIVVVDGGSVDETQQVVSSLRLTNPRLRYIRLDVKGGVDQDYSKAVSLAKGKYCWLMSDDDLLKRGAVEAVLDAMQKDYSLIIVNAEVRTADLARRVAAKRMRMAHDRVYGPGDFDRLFIDTAKYLSFIGGVVIRRDVWDERDKEGYFGSQFAHVGVIFQRPLPGPVLAISEPWIVIRYGNALWTERAFEIWMILWPDLLWSFGTVSEEARRRVQSRSAWSDFKSLMLLRAEGKYGAREHATWLVPRIGSAWHRFLAKAITYLPGCLLNLLAITYFRTVHSWSGLQLIDLWNSPYYYGRWIQEVFGRLRGGTR